MERIRFAPDPAEILPNEWSVWIMRWDPVDSEWKFENSYSKEYEMFEDRWYYDYSRYMRDHVTTRGVWRYNDCTNFVRHSYYYSQYGVGDSGILNIADGHGGIPSIPAYPLVARYYPRRFLIKDSDIYISNPAPLDPQDPQTLKTLELVFADESLPSTLSITKDPFETDFSVWFVLADLWQMKGLVKQLIGSEALNRSFRRLDELPARDTAKELADKHLLVQFGLLPTIKDLQEFASILMNWRDRYSDMDKLLKTRPWHEPKIDISKRFPDITFSGTSPVSINSYGFTHVNMRCDQKTISAEFCRTASYSFVCPEFQGWLARLKQFIDAFGILDPAAIWDNVPFSFVVDWFFGISKWLSKNKPRLFPADVLIHDYCESIKVETERRWYASTYVAPHLPDTGEVVWQDNVFLGRETYTTYLRRRFRPEAQYISVPPSRKAGVVTLRRALISASLVAQRLPR